MRIGMMRLRSGSSQVATIRALKTPGQPGRGGELPFRTACETAICHLARRARWLFASSQNLVFWGVCRFGRWVHQVPTDLPHQTKKKQCAKSHLTNKKKLGIKSHLTKQKKTGHQEPPDQTNKTQDSKSHLTKEKKNRASRATGPHKKNKQCIKSHLTNRKNRASRAI